METAEHEVYHQNRGAFASELCRQRSFPGIVSELTSPTVFKWRMEELQRKPQKGPEDVGALLRDSLVWKMPKKQRQFIIMYSSWGFLTKGLLSILT